MQYRFDNKNNGKKGLLTRYIAMAVVVLLFLWQNLGYNSIVYLAALTSISMELFHAAAIDGCNRFQRIWHVTLPGIMPTIVLLLEACPCAAITTMFAIQFHHDEELAAGAVVFSTLSSILTLPLYALLLTMMLG